MVKNSFPKFQGKLEYDLVSKDSKYKCFIPPLTPGDIVKENNLEKSQIEKLAIDAITPLMKTCFYRIEGWWIYEGIAS